MFAKSELKRPNLKIENEVQRKKSKINISPTCTQANEEKVPCSECLEENVVYFKNSPQILSLIANVSFDDGQDEVLSLFADEDPEQIIDSDFEVDRESNERSFSLNNNDFHAEKHCLNSKADDLDEKNVNIYSEVEGGLKSTYDDQGFWPDYEDSISSPQCSSSDEETVRHPNRLFATKGDATVKVEFGIDTDQHRDIKSPLLPLPILYKPILPMPRKLSPSSIVSPLFPTPVEELSKKPITAKLYELAKLTKTIQTPKKNIRNENVNVPTCEPKPPDQENPPQVLCINVVNPMWQGHNKMCTLQHDYRKIPFIASLFGILKNTSTEDPSKMLHHLELIIQSQQKSVARKLLLMSINHLFDLKFYNLITKCLDISWELSNYLPLWQLIVSLLVKCTDNKFFVVVESIFKRVAMPPFFSLPVKTLEKLFWVLAKNPKGVHYLPKLFVVISPLKQWTMCAKFVRFLFSKSGQQDYRNACSTLLEDHSFVVENLHLLDRNTLIIFKDGFRVRDSHAFDILDAFLECKLEDVKGRIETNSDTIANLYTCCRNCVVGNDWFSMVPHEKKQSIVYNHLRKGFYTCVMTTFMNHGNINDVNHAIVSKREITKIYTSFLGLWNPDSDIETKFIVKLSWSLLVALKNKDPAESAIFIAIKIVSHKMKFEECEDLRYNDLLDCIRFLMKINQFYVSRMLLSINNYAKPNLSLPHSMYQALQKEHMGLLCMLSHKMCTLLKFVPSYHLLQDFMSIYKEKIGLCEKYNLDVGSLVRKTLLGLLSQHNDMAVTSKMINNLYILYNELVTEQMIEVTDISILDLRKLLSCASKAENHFLLEHIFTVGCFRNIYPKNKVQQDLKMFIFSYMTKHEIRASLMGFLIGLKRYLGKKMVYADHKMLKIRVIIEDKAIPDENSSSAHPQNTLSDVQKIIMETCHQQMKPRLLCRKIINQIEIDSLSVYEYLESL